MRSLPHYFRASTLRLVARDLYYRLPLPRRLKWALRNTIIRQLRRRRSGGGAAGELAFGPWSAALAASRRVATGGEEVQHILQHPENLAKHAFPGGGSPVVSIVIPVHNKIDYTVACLLSILFNRPSTAFEVIVVDDASTDATGPLLSHWPGLRYVRNAENLGFIGSCNRGAEAARGGFVCFLNNDTNVLRGWLDELHATFVELPEAGLVGSKLVYPNGELQESGGIVWRDGSAWNYGNLDDPDRPQSSYLRDVDYVSAASIMLRSEIFRDLGGFDTLYRPAYYEDTDLAFRVRGKGLRVLVQPASMVIHYEGVSSGKEPSGGVKRYQLVNHEKFYDRWKEVLAPHRRNGESPELEKERGVTRRMLMVDALVPMPDRDAGSVIADHFIGIFQRLGYKVTFAPENLRYDANYSARLQRRGVECLYYPYEHDVRDFLRRHPGEFELVFLVRPHIADAVLKTVRKTCPGAKLIYNTADLHHLREMRQAQVENNPALARRAEQTKKTELRVIGAADCTIVTNPVEKAMLSAQLPQARLEVIQLIMQEQPPGLPFAERSGLIFIGGSQHPPNGDAVRHFVRHLMPALRAEGIRETFNVIGERSAQEAKDLQGVDVKVLGQVEDIAPHFHRARCMVVPLRYGAGVKGKIGTAFAYGLPVISTAVGVEGMDLAPDQDYLHAETAQDWTRQIRRLMQDQALWTRLSEAGRRIVRERYSPQRVAGQLQQIIQTL